MDDPLTLRPEYESTRVALRTLSEALTLQATTMLGIGSTEFSDPVAAAPWQPSSRSWMAVALVHFGIEVRAVELPALVRDAVVAAQLRQFR